MIWKQSTEVGFGIKNKWIVAWFCPPGNKPDTAEAYVANVNDVCNV